MGVSKSDNFTTKQNELAQYAKALAHPARIAIVQFMMKNPGCITNHLVENLPLAQATISQHLTALKKVGLIKGTIKAPKICYCLEEKKLKKIQKLFNDFTTKALKCC